jgi:hypothetical protein
MTTVVYAFQVQNELFKDGEMRGRRLGKHWRKSTGEKHEHRVKGRQGASKHQATTTKNKKNGFEGQRMLRWLA